MIRLPNMRPRILVVASSLVVLASGVAYLLVAVRSVPDRPEVAAAVAPASPSVGASVLDAAPASEAPSEPPACPPAQPRADPRKPSHVEGRVAPQDSIPGALQLHPTTQDNAPGPLHMPLPLTVPHAPKLDSMIETMERSGYTDVRQSYDFLLGLYAFLDQCAGSGVQPGTASVTIDFLVDDDHHGRVQSMQVDDRVSTPTLRARDLEIVQRCADDYFKAHTAFLPSRPLPNGNRKLRMGATVQFPIRDQEIYRNIAEANSGTL
jgi:hypothetical protein